MKTEEHRTSPCDNESRDWSHSAASQEKLKIACKLLEAKKRQGGFPQISEEAWPLTLDF